MSKALNSKGANVDEQYFRVFRSHLILLHENFLLFDTNSRKLLQLIGFIVSTNIFGVLHY